MHTCRSRSFAAGPARRGLTLVELMVTITIIGILATLFLGALVNAQNEAKLMKTRAMIVKLNNLIMPRYESYRTRRVPVQITYDQVAVGGTANSARPAAQIRVNALHDLMRLEMPDRMTDILGGPNTYTTYTIKGLNIASNSGVFISRPSLSQSYYQALTSNPNFHQPFAIGTNSGQVNTINQGAECLYMIVNLAFVDELGGRDLFNESSIGDTDSDGLPEFIDAWGTPIGFLRWAPGFTESELQGAGGTILAGGTTSLVANGSATQFSTYGLVARNNAYAGKILTSYTGSVNPPLIQSATISSSIYDPTTGHTTLNLVGTGLAHALQSGDTFGIDPDPFDPVHAWPWPNFGGKIIGPYGAGTMVPFALYPLIYSAGPNKVFGIVSDFGDFNVNGVDGIQYGLPATAITTPAVYNYPYLIDTNGQMVGAMCDLTKEESTSGWESNSWKDNVHNHLLGLR